MADPGLGVQDVHDKGAEIDNIETFIGVVKNSVVDVVDYHCKLIACDGEDHLVGVPCLASGSVGGTKILAVGGCGTCWDDWVSQRFNMWDVECPPITCQIDGWILQKA